MLEGWFLWFILLWVIILISLFAIGGFFMFRKFLKRMPKEDGRSDMDTSMDDFIHASKETNNIVGIPEAYGGGGDSSIPTALGVIYGLKATNKVVFGTDDLSKKTFTIQGLGKVGFKVAEQLLESGADLYVSDINEDAVKAIQERAKQLGSIARAVSGNDLYSVKADVFVPCAFGGIINDETIELLKVKAVSGSANNQLLTEKHGEVLKQKGILYAPDYIVNAGGLIQVADELYGYNKERVLSKTRSIYTSFWNSFVLQSARKWQSRYFD